MNFEKVLRRINFTFGIICLIFCVYYYGREEYLNAFINILVSLVNILAYILLKKIEIVKDEKDAKN